MLFNRNPHWPKHAFAFKGGSVGAPTTYAPPAPPAASNAAAVQAKADARQQMLMKQGITSTILNPNPAKTGQSGTLLGSPGSYFKQQQGAGLGKNSLLGGG